MKISIVLPVYNQERFLRDALESVGVQTYSDIEIVVVNDGSTDSSLRIATEYAKRDPRVKIVSQDNGGLLAANVTGIKAATGDYICFFDPDDRIGPTSLPLLLAKLMRSLISLREVLPTSILTVRLIFLLRKTASLPAKN